MLEVEIKMHSAVTGKTSAIEEVLGNVDRSRLRALLKRAPLRTGEVLDYPRLSYNVWRLVSRALRSAFQEEK